MRHVEARDTASGEEEAGLRLGSDDLATCGSLALLLIAAYLLNAYIFPSVAFLFPAGREISTYCGVGFSVGVSREPLVAHVSRAVRRRIGHVGRRADG